MPACGVRGAASSRASEPSADRLEKSMLKCCRTRRAWIAVVWLMSQASGLAVAPGRMVCDHVESMMSAGSDDCDHPCCKRLPPGRKCPMHRHRGMPSAQAGHDAHHSGMHDAGASHAAHPASLAEESTGADTERAMRAGCDRQPLIAPPLLQMRGVLTLTSTVADDLTIQSEIGARPPMPIAAARAPDIPPPR